jgi:hypothetical protein
MVLRTCPCCNKEFNKKSTFVYHVNNKKNPCNITTKIVPPNSFKSPPNPPILSPHQEKLIELLIKEPEPNDNNCVCAYCEKIFTRIDSLKKHVNGRCKSKENYDELDKLKEDMKLIIQNYQKLENNYQNLLDEQKGELPLEDKLVNEIVENDNNIKTINNTINNNVNNEINANYNNQTNKGVILNNTVNVKVVKFGSEDINKLNLIDAIKSYLKSTGGNIASTMLSYINLNKDYPENNNICMTDMSREIVKIYDGEKFVYKKFKNGKDEILKKTVINIRRIVDKYINDETFKKSLDTKTKLQINDVSLKIIDGISAEDIVREEIREKEKHLIKTNKKKKKDNENSDSESESEEEREFTFEERLKIDHLENKREGMQQKTFENIKEGLYNNRMLVQRSIVA